MNTKMTFRRNIKNQNRRGLSTPRKFLAIGLAVFFLLALVLQDFSFKFAIRPFFYAMEPLLETKKDLKNWWEGKRAGFAEKKNILAENRALTEKAAEMKISLSFLEIFEKENAELKAAFSAEERKNYIFGSVISRPPFTPYDLLIIDAGAKDGVEEGMQVLAFGKVLLGYAADVFPDKSKVKLISSFGEETNVVLESSGIPAIAAGKGGENFEIILSRMTDIGVGEKIITDGKNPLLVGIVEKIERQATDPYQKIIFRLPINIQALTKVFLLKK